jgi:hypothetical protein
VALLDFPVLKEISFGEWGFKLGGHVGSPSTVRKCPRFELFCSQMFVVGDRRSSICTTVSVCLSAGFE